MAHNDSVILISSSPEFPSIHELVKPPKKPALRSGSNAAPIPENALMLFTTATSVWRSALAGQETSDGDRAMDGVVTVPELDLVAAPESPPEPAPAKPPAKPKKAPKTSGTRRKKKADLDTTGACVEGAAVMDGSAIAGATSTTETPKPARKRRSVKNAAEVQTTLPKGKVTKPAAKEKPSKKKAETVSRHFTPEVSQQQAKATRTSAPTSNPILDEPLHLETAIRRRTDWTPPPKDIPLRSIGDSAVKEPSSRFQVSEDSQKDVFGALLDTYNCGEQRGGDPVTSTNSDVLGKRKLIQLVATTAVPVPGQSKTAETSPAKAKAPKKKPRTITELATAAYRVSDESETSATKGSKKQSLMSYLGVEAGEPSNNGAAKGTKGPKKPAKPRVTKKKLDPRQQTLLSPTSAMGQVARQDFVFGTASQLATEDDPDLLRALHEAMKVSNQVDDPFCSSPVATSLMRVGNKLWVAGNRDGDGDLLNLDVFDLTESPPVVRDRPLTQGLPVKGKEKATSPARLVQSQRIEIEIASSDSEPLYPAKPPPKLHFILTQPKAARVPRHISVPSPEKPPDQQESIPAEPEFEPPPSNQEHNQLLERSRSSSPEGKAPEGPPRPKYELFTDAQLAKEISSYGFKLVKKRTAMIALLDQCWASKNPTALGSRIAQASMATSAPSQTGPAPTALAPSPTRARGRPRKDSATTTTETEHPQPEKRGRGRPKRDATAAAPANALKSKAKAPTKAVAAKVMVVPESQELPAVATPKHCKAPTKPVEIADSDSDMDPFLSSPVSSPERNQEQLFSSPSQAPDVSITEDTEMSLLAVSPTTQQKALFDYITRAVTTAPRTKDPANPSWHEKMLMYDPIILEDLAAWLNGGQLDKVGYDGEVAPGDVKKWCESKSVCCLWRVNLHGKERKRF